MENKGGNIPAYHHMVEELKEKLRISEESRKSLQQKFDIMMQTYKVKEQARYNALRKRYGVFLKEDQRRQQRNENLLQMLERIDNRSANLAARTERLALLRKHYEQYLGQMYPSWKVSPHKLTPGPPSVKIGEYRDEDVSGYGTHTGSSGYARETERYAEPRIPPISTPRASVHQYKTDTLLPDKYRIPRIDFDTPSISVTKPDEGGRSQYLEVRQPKPDMGRLNLNKMSEVGARSVGDISPRDRTPRGQHLGQPEFEVDQNTSGDLLNMSLSDDGVPSLTRSETDAATRHHYWETLRHTYLNRQQPTCQDNESNSADESLQDMGWSQDQRRKPPEVYDYRSTENAPRPVQQEQTTEEVSLERESFRDKIRRLKVMIQENKEMERSIDAPVQDRAGTDQTSGNSDVQANKNTDSSLQQQRVRRQSTVEGLELAKPQNINSGQGDRIFNSKNETVNAFQHHADTGQSIVDGSGSVIPQSKDRLRGGDSNIQGSEQQNRVQGSDESPARFHDEQSHYTPDLNQRQQLEPMRNNDNQNGWRSVQNSQQKSAERQAEIVEDQSRVPQSGEEQFYQESNSKDSIDPVQAAQYLEQSRDYNTNNQDGTFGYNEQYASAQGRPSGYAAEQANLSADKESKENRSDTYSESKRTQDAMNANSGRDTGQYQDEEKRDTITDGINGVIQPDNTSKDEQYNEDNTTNNQHEQKVQGFYGDQNQNYEGQGYNHKQGDEQYEYQYPTDQSGGNYYSQPQPPEGQGAAPDQKSYGQSNEQEYYQEKLYYGQEDPSSAEYVTNNQYSNQYESQKQEYDPQRQYDSQQQQQYDPQQQQQYDPQQQQYDPQQQQYDTQQQQQYDPQKEQYDQQQQQQYVPQQQQEYDPQQQQQYDQQQQQQYDPQKEQYDQQQQQRNDPQQQQQYEPQQQQQYEPQQQQQYEPQQQQQYEPQQQQYDQLQQQYDQQQQQYDPQQYDTQQYNPQKTQDSTHKQYEYYGQQSQDEYGYDPQGPGRDGYQNPRQDSSKNYTGAGGNLPLGAVDLVSMRDEQGYQQRAETDKNYPEVSDDSTLESDKSREEPMGRSQESPSQRSIDRYRTMLGVDPNSEPAYSEVEEIEDEMAAVVASGAGASRTQTANNGSPDRANITSQNQPKQLEKSPKQVHDDSSDFEYSSGP